jgi:hypothetical protein
MSIASNGARTTNGTITQAACEIRTTAGVVARVLELQIIQSVGTAQSLGLGRPQALGATPGTTTLFQRDVSSDPACVTSQNLSWVTSPTVPLIFHRRWNSAATIGVGVTWTFPRGLLIPVSASLVVWNITAGQLSDVNVVIDE